MNLPMGSLPPEQKVIQPMNSVNEENYGDLPFTGERYLPEISGQIAFEHLHRYYLAREYASGLRVLDVACGEGYGSSIVAPVAKAVVGVDISRESVEHAQRKYPSENLSFVEASAADLPFGDNEFDLVMSFETIEHHDLHEEMMSEIRRVLKPDGMLIISSPNKQHYSVDENYNNPFHVKELYKEEFLALVKRRFSHCVLLGQRVIHGSLVALEEARYGGFQSFSEGLRPEMEGVNVDSGLRSPLYDIIIASDRELPELASSIFEMSVHGMDPARFYGAHLPDRVSTADQRILALESELDVAPLSAQDNRNAIDSATRAIIEEGRSLFGAVSDTIAGGQIKMDAILDSIREMKNKQELQATEHEALRELLANTRLQLENSQNAYAEARKEIEVGHGQLEQARQSAAEHRSMLEQVSAELDKIQSERQGLSEALSGMRTDSEKVIQELADAREELASIRNSHSWRSTAWLRALSRMIRGERSE